MAKIIAKDTVDELLKKLASYDIYGPVEEDGVVRYRMLSGKSVLDFTNSQKPPKEVLFPQTEKMFDLEKKDNRFVDTKEPELSDKPILVFGMRPCDARAIAALDKLFTWDYIDPYYVNRRERTTMIGLSCTLPQMPQESCFCTSMGGSPGSTDGLDMLWTDIGGKYYVEPLTDKGKKLLEAAGGLFTDAQGGDDSAAGEAKKKAEAAITRKLELDGVKEALQKTFDNPYWDEFAARCLGCGICTLLCPTCHCFDINDVVRNGKGSRERTWDSCQYSHYTAHASGHNPRPAKKHRQRNRIYHKLLYMDEKLGVLGCVGCGRCISGCPVNIDIIEVTEGCKEVAK